MPYVLYRERRTDPTGSPERLTAGSFALCHWQLHKYASDPVLDHDYKFWIGYRNEEKSHEPRSHSRVQRKRVRKGGA